MVYVDSAVWPYRAALYCHLSADTLAELHAFALQLGLKRTWFQCPPKSRYPHYDLAPSRRAKAVQLGAKEVDRRTILEKVKALKQEYESDW